MSKLDELINGLCSDGVEWKHLREVALEFGRGKSKHRPRNDSRLYGGIIPFIQTGDIRSAPHIIWQFTQTYSKFGLEQSKLWPKGTLCITIAANIAETAILGFDSCFPDSVIGFVANPQKTNSSYVEYLLASYKSKLQSKSTGSLKKMVYLHQQQYNEITIKDENTVYITPTDNYGRFRENNVETYDLGVVSKLIPEGGVDGQVLVRATKGTGWMDAPAGEGVITERLI